MTPAQRALLRRLYLGGQAGPGLQARTFYALYMVTQMLGSFGKTKRSVVAFERFFPDLSAPAEGESGDTASDEDEYGKAMREYQEQTSDDHD